MLLGLTTGKTQKILLREQTCVALTRGSCFLSRQRIHFLCLFRTVILIPYIKLKSICSKFLSQILVPVTHYLENDLSHSEYSRTAVLWGCLSLLLSCLDVLLLVSLSFEWKRVAA